MPQLTVPLHQSTVPLYRSGCVYDACMPMNADSIKTDNYQLLARWKSPFAVSTTEGCTSRHNNARQFLNTGDRHFLNRGGEKAATLTAVSQA